jgi:hypothetical protein
VISLEQESSLARSVEETGKRERGGNVRKRNKTNRLKAMLKRKNVKSSLRKSKGERKYPT